MTLFLQEMISGISIGSIYAMLALGLVVIFRAAGVGNFAQGALATLAAFISWTLNSHGVPVGLALILSILASFGIGALVYAMIRKLEVRSTRIVAVFCTFGLYIGIEGAIGIIWGYTPVSPAGLFPNSSVGPRDLGITWALLGILVVTALTGMAMYLVFTKTRIGLSMRAVVSNRESSRLVGIRIGWTLTFGWGLSCMVGAVAGVLAAPVVYLQPTMLDNVLLYAFAGAVLGGMTSYVGAVVGSLVVGVLQAVIGTYVPALGGNLSLLVALAVIWLALLARPQGLFAGASAEHLPW